MRLYIRNVTYHHSENKPPTYDFTRITSNAHRWATKEDADEALKRSSIKTGSPSRLPLTWGLAPIALTFALSHDQRVGLSSLANTLSPKRTERKAPE